jgi:amino acid adenylation domain-containing protein
MRFLLQHGLEISAATDPARVAVIDGERRLTYAQLEARANQLGRLLLSLGVDRGDRIGLYLDKSLESLIGIYGTLKSGAAYVPMDPQAPPARLAYIAKDCGIRVVLTGAEKATAWPDVLSAASSVTDLVVLNEEPFSVDLPDDVRLTGPRACDGFDDTRPEAASIGLDLAYILYTSGSTGRPKGVMLSHVNGLTFVDWAVERFGVTADDRLSSHAPLHFDLSIFDVFAASTAGATVVLVPPRTSFFPVEVARFIERNEITIWYSVPSILNMLVTRGNIRPGQFPKLRTLLFAGEVFPTRYLRQLMELMPDVRFCNLYGPTETNVCTWYDVVPIPETQTEPIPIGQAISGVEVIAVTEDGRHVDVGEVGELYVRGPTVMQGYWGDADKTAASLVTNPLPHLGPDLAYRTGDLVRRESDGNYRLLGRRDHQIKSRGYRIELGEIEAVLLAHPGVAECAVTATPDPVITNRIRAHVVVSDELSEAELFEFCVARLPRHMIPETFEFRATLPKTSTGKTDRQALIGDAQPQ